MPGMTPVETNHREIYEELRSGSDSSKGDTGEFKTQENKTNSSIEWHRKNVESLDHKATLFPPWQRWIGNRNFRAGNGKLNQVAGLLRSRLLMNVKIFAIKEWGNGEARILVSKLSVECVLPWNNRPRADLLNTIWTLGWFVPGE